MSHQLNDQVRHNVWSNRYVYDYLAKLPESTLELHVRPGGFGDIRQTLRHIIDSEASYLRRLEPSFDPIPWEFQEDVEFAVIGPRIELLAAAWERLLAGEFDQEALAQARGDGGVVYDVSKGVILAQAIHHGSEHRSQICDILGYHGFDAPEIGAWEYALATGRMREAPASGA